jgi:uncharacterized membrane protein YvbJ
MSDSADHDHESSSNADASFCCADCGHEFDSLQELKEQRTQEQSQQI